MRFSKYNQPRHHGGGRKPSAATIAKRQAAAEAEQQQRKAAEEKAFADFETAENGYFSGYSMVEIFHQKHDKRKALETLTADDCADVITSAGATIHAGEDGVTVYVMTEAARRGDVKKIVRFNRSVYAF